MSTVILWQIAKPCSKNFAHFGGILPPLRQHDMDCCSTISHLTLVLVIQKGRQSGASTALELDKSCLNSGLSLVTTEQGPVSDMTCLSPSLFFRKMELQFLPHEVVVKVKEMILASA